MSSTPQTINILDTAPTFDLTEWEIIGYNKEDKIIFCESSQVFKFDKCKGTIMPRSRILRQECGESKFFKNVISATIDAGFVGKLFFKIELTDASFQDISSTHIPFEKGGYDMKKILSESSFEFHRLIQNCVQIDLNPFPRNYYQGTNQTDLTPDVVFTSSKPERDFIPWWERVSEEDCLEWARYYEMNNPNSTSVITNKTARLTDKEFDKLVDELDKSNKSNFNLEEASELANQVVKEVRKTSEVQKVESSILDESNP